MSWCSCFLLICHWSKSDIRADKCCKVAFFLESSFSSTFFSNASCLALRVRVSERTLRLLWFKNSLARFSAISKDFIWTSNTCLRQDWNLDSNSCLRLSTLENRWWSGPLKQSWCKNVHHVRRVMNDHILPQEEKWQIGKWCAKKFGYLAGTFTLVVSCYLRFSLKVLRKNVMYIWCRKIADLK